MAVAFPLTPVPSYYTQITPGQNHGVFYSGGTAPSVVLSKSGATAYSVNDYYGNVVSSGSVSGLTVTPTAPVGGWRPGWYRIYFTGPSTDSLFGPAYASYTFVVIRNDGRFPAIPAATSTGGEARDIPCKGALGIGTSRLTIGSVLTPTVGSDTLAMCQTDATASTTTYWSVSSGAYYDAARPRPMWTNFPAQTYDFVTVGGLHVYCKDGTIDGSTVTVTAVNGTSSGTKITINAETYDNLASVDLAIAALQTSAYVRGFGSGNLANISATAIGNAYFNGVKSVVTALYPYGITRFEGPSNEPTMTIETVQQMRLFQAAVHAGNASALAIGPCSVSIGGVGSSWETFLAAGGATYCDELSFHDYNAQTQGDINLGRVQISAFIALLAKYGLSSKPLWQTEATQVMVNIYGVYHPRRSRVPLLQTLLWEQYGVPRERNNIWYDRSHGFWAFPTWWQHSDNSLNPEACLYRTLAEETFGQVHSQALSFGTYGDKIWLGSLYTGIGGSPASTAVIQMISYIPGATITLSVTGAASLTVIDGFGNSSTVAVTNGLAVIPTADTPTYVRLPNGVTVTVYTCNDWPPLSQQGAWAGGAYGYNTSPVGTVTPASSLVDNQWIYAYGSSPNGVAHGTAMPDTATISWPTATRLDRVLIWSGFAWQADSALATFTVDTSVDGVTWVTQRSVDVSAGMTSFQFGADFNGTGCQRETYWPEQYIFDVKLPAPVTCKAIRISATASSYGGEPDVACVTTGGQGNAIQTITLQEVVTLCDDNVTPHYATLQ